MFNEFIKYLTFPYLLEGASIAVQIWLISFIISSAIGMVFALIRQSKHMALLRYLVVLYVWFIRGTPIILQLVVWYNLLPLLGYNINEFWTAVIALSVCFSAYLCEVFRGGLMSVQPGQIEAAQSMGFGRLAVTRFFAIPQALRTCTPSLINFAILLMKDTSITSVIAVSELTLRSNIIVARNFEYVPVFGAALCIYLLLTTALTLVQHYSESFLDYESKERRLLRRTKKQNIGKSGTLVDFLAGAQSSGKQSEDSVRFRGVTKSFGENIVLQDINLTIKSGQTTCILGPSGAGKSTLLRTINLLEPIDSGSVWVNGLDVADLSWRHWYRRAMPESLKIARRRKAATAMVFQQFNLFENYSVLGNLSLAPIHVMGWDRHKVKKEALQLLNLLGLSALANRMPQRLSGGEKQRIGILRALAVRPKTLLFDEPTSALDPERVGEVINVMRDLSAASATMVVVTHEIEFAKTCANWIVFMADGRVVEEGYPEDIFMSPKTDRFKQFLEGIKNQKI
ncbi:MAG: amino acid ABC transporter permease/ATP-binding protein [Paralcaligenes sp.]